MSETNRKYKDSLFRMLFGREENKENTLSLYNALNGTDYKDASGLTFYTISDVVYVGMKNDLSFVVSDELNLYEHQSTVNPNMPIRGLIYFARNYESYFDINELNKYSGRLQMIPPPRYIVLYNGIEPAPAYQEMKLSDAFIKSIEPGTYEWTAYVYNINPGMNDTLLDKCPALKEYMTLVNLVRKNGETMSRDSAIDEAVRTCIDNGILSDFLKKNRSEVQMSFLTEYDEEKYHATLRKEMREDLREEVKQEVKEEVKQEIKEEEVNSFIDRLLNSGKFSDKEISLYANTTCENVAKRRKVINSTISA